MIVIFGWLIVNCCKGNQIHGIGQAGPSRKDMGQVFMMKHLAHAFHVIIGI
jgi:hypothetical protein